jgi:RHS repeat-associated protein
LYSGEQFDSKIGQQYLRASYYDPATGRFNRLDPFFGNQNDPQSFHKYLYTHADPVNGIDPSGLIIGGSLGVAITNTIGAGLRGMHTVAISSVAGGVTFAAISSAMFTTHLLLPIYLDGTGFQSDVEMLPDAAVLGISGSSRKIMKAIEKMLIHSDVMAPLTPFVGAPMDLLGMLSECFQLSVEGSIEIVMNIASAQLTVFAYAGIQTPGISSAQISDNLSIYSGLVWNLPNNKSYRGMGSNISLGTLELFSDLSFSYFGAAVHKTISGTTPFFSIGAGIAAPIPGLSWNFPTCHASVAMATLWGGITTAFLPGGANFTTIVGGAGLAGFWPYGKWTPPNLLPQIQNG